jgi:hypothetical protein
VVKFEFSWKIISRVTHLAMYQHDNLPWNGSIVPIVITILSVLLGEHTENGGSAANENRKNEAK